MYIVYTFVFMSNKIVSYLISFHVISSHLFLSLLILSYLTLTLQCSNNPLCAITADTQHTFLQTPTQLLQQTYNQTCAKHIHLLYLGNRPQEEITKYCAHLHIIFSTASTYAPGPQDLWTDPAGVTEMLAGGPHAVSEINEE